MDELIKASIDNQSGSNDWLSVAAVIPCFNAEKRVGRAIQSVIDQECPKTPWFDVALWHKAEVP